MPPDPVHVAFITLGLLSISIWGLVSLWASMSDVDLVWRGLALTLWLSPLLTIPAHELILFFIVQTIVISLGVWLWLRSSRSASTTPKTSFSLKSLLLFTLLAGIVLSIIARAEVPTQIVWAALVTCASVSGMATLLGAWWALDPWRWRKLPIAVVTIALVAIPASMLDVLLTHFPQWDRRQILAAGLGGVGSRAMPENAAWSVFAFAVLLLVTILLLLYRGGTLASGRRRWIYQAMLTCCLLGILVPIARVSWLIPNFLPGGPQPNTSGPSGFELFREAAKVYKSGNAIGDYGRAGTQQLANDLAKNSQAIELVRKGIEMPFLPDLDTNQNELLALLGSYREFARMLMADAELARREERWEAAVSSSLETVQLGHRIDDASLVNGLVGVAIQAMAHSMLVEIRGELSSEQLQDLATKLVEIDRDATTAEQVLAADRAWSQRQFGWRMQLYYALSVAIGSESSGDSAFQRSADRVKTIRRLIIADISLQSFYKSHGKYPEDLSQLILPLELLQDPCSPDKSMLRYQPSDEGFLLYSVGDDGRDDAGKPVAWWYDEDGGDWILDELMQTD